MLDLEVRRRWFTEASTEGELWAKIGNEWKFVCFTLEDKDRGDDLAGSKKVYGQTAIGCGRYPIKITFSKKFGQDMPELFGVPFFQFIRIHPGNWPKDTEGCLLVGKVRMKDEIESSTAAYKEVYRLIKDAWDRKEEIWITYKRDPNAGLFS